MNKLNNLIKFGLTLTILLFISSCTDTIKSPFNLGTTDNRILVAPDSSVVLKYEVGDYDIKENRTEDYEGKYITYRDTKNKMVEINSLFTKKNGEVYRFGSMLFGDNNTIYDYEISNDSITTEESFSFNRFGSSRDGYYYYDKFTLASFIDSLQNYNMVRTYVKDQYLSCYYYPNKDSVIYKNLKWERIIDIPDHYSYEYFREIFFNRMNSKKRGEEIAGLLYDPLMDRTNYRVKDFEEINYLKLPSKVRENIVLYLKIDDALYIEESKINSQVKSYKRDSSFVVLVYKSAGKLKSTDVIYFNEGKQSSLKIEGVKPEDINTYKNNVIEVILNKRADFDQNTLSYFFSLEQESLKPLIALLKYVDSFWYRTNIIDDFEIFCWFDIDEVSNDTTILTAKYEFSNRVDPWSAGEAPEYEFELGIDFVFKGTELVDTIYHPKNSGTLIKTILNNYYSNKESYTRYENSFDPFLLYMKDNL